MIDIVREIESVQREVGTARIAAGEGRMVRLRRTYPAAIDDVWDALTNPERIGRWFLPISGDFRIGGHYQFEGNAGGTIVACERPHRLAATWVYMDTGNPADVSEVEVRLSEAGDDATTLELEHTAIVPDEMWDQFGPGAVGVGWEGGLLGLELHLRGGTVGDPIAWGVSEEARTFNRSSSAEWGTAYIAAGADPEAAARAVAGTNEFYAPTTPAGDS